MKGKQLHDFLQEQYQIMDSTDFQSKEHLAAEEKVDQVTFVEGLNIRTWAMLNKLLHPNHLTEPNIDEMVAILTAAAEHRSIAEAVKLPPSVDLAIMLIQNRFAHDLSQSELSRRTGIAQSTIAKYESYTEKMSFDNFMKLMRAMDPETQFYLSTQQTQARKAVG